MSTVPTQFQQWRYPARHWPEPVCPGCAGTGYIMCVRCHRWWCRIHRPGLHHCSPFAVGTPLKEAITRP